MSETMTEWPTIDAVEPKPIEEIVVLDNSETLPVPPVPTALQILREHSLAELSAVDRGLAKLAAEHGSTDYDISTAHGYKLATARRHAIRLVRYQVPKVVKAKRAELNELRDAVATEGERITALLLAIEQPHDDLIQAEDARKEAERAEKARAESERKERHEASIKTLCSYADRCAGLSSERIAAGIAQLEGIQINEGWEEFKERAELAKAATLESMRRRHAAAFALEAEVARLEAQRIENERIAAEQAAERERLAEAAAKVKAEALELQRRIDEQLERQEAERVARAEREYERKLLALHSGSDALGVSAEAKAAVLANGGEVTRLAKEVVEFLGSDGPPAGGPNTIPSAVEADDRSEVLIWHDANKSKPAGDSPLSVLCWGGDSTAFFCGYWCDERRAWINNEERFPVDGVTHWADPKGPMSGVDTPQPPTKESNC